MQRNALFQHVFEQTPETRLLLDEHWHVLAASEVYRHRSEREREDIEGRSVFELPPFAGFPERAARLRQMLEATGRGTAPTSGPIDPDCTPCFGPFDHVGAQPLLAEGTRLYVVRFSAAGDDAAPDEASARRLRALVEHSYEAILMLDAYARVTYVSPSIERVLGYTEQEFRALTPLSLIAPETLERNAELLAATQKPGTQSFILEGVRHRDGSLRAIEVRTTNLLDEPAVASIIANFRDVTEHVQLQAELRRSRDQLRMALQAGQAIGWDWDLDTDSLVYSNNPSTFFGTTNSGTATGDIEQLVHPGDREAVKTAMAQSVARGADLRMEFRGNTPPESVRHFATHGQVLGDASGRPARVIGLTWDVTSRKAAEQERLLLDQRMQESQKLESLGVLAGGIAHDFNNILMAILGNASLLQRALTDEDPSLGYVTQLEEAARRASDLCRQMLAYAGKGRFVLAHTDLNALIEQTVHLLRVSISKKAVMRFHLEPSLPAIVGDTTQLRQVLMNLVINASDAIGDKSGVITIATGIVRADRDYLDKSLLSADIPEGTYVSLEVSDTGSGMSQETQARIFEPFFTTKFTGRGLGLAAVLGIVRGHGGALRVYSERGKGSCFKLLLPVAEGAAPRVESPRPPSRRKSTDLGTILVVDDEETVRAVAAHLLERLGFAVLAASDGREAIDVYRGHRDRIIGVLMDLTMPHLDGEEAFRELRRIDPEVRVLLMSGYNEQEAVARFVGKGLAGFIQKPFGIEELDRSLAQLLA